MDCVIPGGPWVSCFLLCRAPPKLELGGWRYGAGLQQVQGSPEVCAALQLCGVASWVSLGHSIAHTSRGWVFTWLCCHGSVPAAHCAGTQVLAEMRVGGVGT